MWKEKKRAVVGPHERDSVLGLIEFAFSDPKPRCPPCGNGGVISPYRTETQNRHKRSTTQRYTTQQHNKFGVDFFQMLFKISRILHTVLLIFAMQFIYTSGVLRCEVELPVTPSQWVTTRQK